jgi:hypothetical protein
MGDSNSPPEYNLGNILKQHESDGKKTGTCGIKLLLESHIPPMSELEPGNIPAPTSPKLTEISWDWP